MMRWLRHLEGAFLRHLLPVGPRPHQVAFGDFSFAIGAIDIRAEAAAGDGRQE